MQNKSKKKITLDDIELKKINSSHLQKIKKWRNLESIRKFNYQFTLLNMKNQYDWYSSLSTNDTQKIFLVLKNSKPIGICGLIHIDKENKNADVSIILGEQSLHGKGIGSIILQKLIKYGFKKYKLHRIGAEIFEFNEISVHLFEGLSFKKEATLRQSLWRNNKWWSIYIYSIINENNS